VVGDAIFSRYDTTSLGNQFMTLLSIFRGLQFSELWKCEEEQPVFLCNFRNWLPSDTASHQNWILLKILLNFNWYYTSDMKCYQIMPNNVISFLLTSTSDTHSPECVIPNDVLIQVGRPDDEHLLLKTCRGMKQIYWERVRQVGH
jgi:hypothetical protein